MKEFVSPDLPRPSLAEGDSYSDGGVKTSVADASTTTARSRQRSSSSLATMRLAAVLGLELGRDGSEE